MCAVSATAVHADAACALLTLHAISVAEPAEPTLFETWEPELYF